MKRFWPLALLVIFVLAVLAVGTHLEENRQKSARLSRCVQP